MCRAWGLLLETEVGGKATQWLHSASAPGLPGCRRSRRHLSSTSTRKRGSGRRLIKVVGGALEGWRQLGRGEGLTLPLGSPGVGEGLTLGANCCSCRDGNTDVLKDQTPPPDPSRFKPPGTSLSTHPTTHWGHPVPQELLLSVAKSLSLRPQHSFFTPVSRKKGPLCTPSPTSAWSVVLHPAFLGGLFPF